MFVLIDERGKTMKRLSVVIILNILMTGLYAQVNKYGTPVSRSYDMNVTHGSEEHWAITKDKFGALWFGGDDGIVIRYDGSRWTRIPFDQNNQAVVRALASDENGIIYVGGSLEFGYIEPDTKGARTYRSMTDRFPSATEITKSFAADTSKIDNTLPSERTIGEIRSLVIRDSKVYFMSPGALIIYNTLIDSLYYVNLRKLGLWQSERIYRIKDKIIIANNIRGLFELRENAISQLPGGDFFGYKMCLTILPYDNNRVIVGTLNNGVFLYDFSSGVVDGNFIDQGFSRKANDLYIYSGTNLPMGDFALGTTTDGVYIFNRNGVLTGHLTSSTIDMKDDVVTALYSDPELNSELWISVTGSLTKAYVNLPFTQFSQKSGLSGSVNYITDLNGRIFVATDQGLFRSSLDAAGHRIFSLSDNLNSQIFALCTADSFSPKFMLAGTQFDGIYQVFPDRAVKLDITQNPTRSIYQSKFRKSRFYFGFSTSTIAICDYINGKWEQFAMVHSEHLAGSAAFFEELPDGDLVILTTYKDALYRLPFNDSVPVRYGPDKGIPEISLQRLFKYQGSIMLSTGRGLLRMDTANDTWMPHDDITRGYTSGKDVIAAFPGHDGDLWVETQEERHHDIIFREAGDSVRIIRGGPLSALPDLKSTFASVVENRMWLSKSSSIFVFDDPRFEVPLPSIQTLLTKIVISSHEKDSLVMNETFFKDGAFGKRYPAISNTGLKPPEYRYKFNSPSFYWTTPYMVQEEDITYSYKLEGFEDDWSEWDRIGYKDFTNLSYGKYTFRVKARTVTGIESREASFNFVILKPWYVTPWMILLYIIASILAVFGIITAYTRRLKSENIRLEGIVRERTAVVVKQKEELESSIHYASRIQMALLPSETILSENIKNYFILFRPRDIVSGDFYWMMKKDERLYIVAADCTGHGVPGAFMSLLGMSFLDEIIDKETAPRADHVLNQLRLHVTESLKQVGGEDEAKDGIDMALLVVDFQRQRVEFSGAYNPCFKVRKLRDGEAGKYGPEASDNPDGSMTNGRYLLETIHASKMPIGISSRMHEDFEFYDWELEKGISYYMFSDGYIDQFGGEHGRKFMKKNFKRLLLDIQDYPMSRQKEILEKNLKDWMGSSPQIDDILVMGIRTD
jgi:serine phosphatase RsbU (regulator of sigma subunit)/ligand-binding sensor domain-containing protein